MSHKVLIVEDKDYIQARWRQALDGRVEVVSAFSIKEAMDKFATNPDVVAIVMDACVPGEEPTTPPLVTKFRETFKGPMIAASAAPWYRKELMRAGCDHESQKDDVPQKLLEILGL